LKIRRCPLLFNRVISRRLIGDMKEWYTGARELRNMVIKNGLYGTGPVFYQVSACEEEGKMKFNIYLPVNVAVKFKDNDIYSYNEKMYFEDGLLLRHADLDEELELSYTLLRACAEDQGLKLKEPFYNIYLEVYGDGIIDIYAPIVKEVEE